MFSTELRVIRKLRAILDCLTKEKEKRAKSTGQQNNKRTRENQQNFNRHHRIEEGSFVKGDVYGLETLEPRVRASSYP